MEEIAFPIFRWREERAKKAGLQAKRDEKSAKIVEVICPSPLDLKSNGVVKVTVLGKKGFCIGRIDPMSARLEGVALKRFAIEDLAAPINGRKCATDTIKGFDRA